MKREWDVSDIDPTNQPPGDCRLYNGGLVATDEEQKLWKDSESEEETAPYKGPLFIDRLEINYYEK